MTRILKAKYHVECNDSLTSWNMGVYNTPQEAQDFIDRQKNDDDEHDMANYYKYRIVPVLSK